MESSEIGDLESYSGMQGWTERPGVQNYTGIA